MPTYDYKCPKCGWNKTFLLGINYEPEIKCPECETILVRGFGGGSGIHFKGSGFYETDYKGK